MTAATERAGARMAAIEVPEEVKRLIDDYARVHGRPAWRVVMDAASLYAAYHGGRLRERDGSRPFPPAGKAAWYAAKLAMAVGAVKADPSPGRVKKLHDVMSQVRKRLGVNCDVLEFALYDYIAARQSGDPERVRDAEIELTGALNIVIQDMIWHAVQSTACARGDERR
jgi:hypothetical protein